MFARPLSLAAVVAATSLLAPTVARPCDCEHGKKNEKTARHEGHGAMAGMTGDEADPHAAHRAAAAAAAAAPAPAGAAAQIRFPDEALLDQSGKERRFVSDVLSDHIVVLDFIFTTCTTVCPVLSGIMSGVQQGLGEGARDVSLVSLTIDPARDTPPRLQAYAQRWNAKAGWTFLTGKLEAVNRVLDAAGAYSADFTAHAPMVLVGDARTGKWVRLNGFPKRAQVLATIDALRAQRATVSAATGVDR